MFKVAIIGGEGTNNYEFFKEKCIKLLSRKAKSGEGILIYSTGDEYANKFAKRYGIDQKVFYTDWHKYGKQALKMRNEEMLKDCDALIAFNDGIKDTNMIHKLAVEKGIQCRKLA